MQAIFYLVLGLVFIFGSFWLVAVFGSNIFVVGIDFVLLLNAMGCLVEALHVYVADIEPQRPHQRERYLESWIDPCGKAPGPLGPVRMRRVFCLCLSGSPAPSD